ncbi:DNA replication checkpoint protein tel2 [Diplogelasinospora grovesii]|uniref:DNA replication checkpoint protein tel2 n=1 Tax=Diplogelasinospora grovesii TaxID=303347 RepID=A0AAN6N5Q2_9PEZI|nr:DNA replication checkpoint protein tel2 [Diplogelasinospora grovesii]
MDGLLTPVSTTYRAKDKAPLLEEVKPLRKDSKPDNSLNSPEDALEILRHEPGYQSLISVLQFLSRDQAGDGNAFNITKPSPLSAQLVQVLVSEIAPNYWTLLKEDSTSNKKRRSGFDLLLACLRSITAINAVLTRLRALIQEAKSDGAGKGKSDVSLNLGILLDLLCALLPGDDCVQQIWSSTIAGHQENPAKLRPLSQELLATFGSGRIISVTAEAEELAKNRRKADMDGNIDIWLADGSKYTQWLGRNIATLQSSEPSSEHKTKFASGLFAKALRLGYSDNLIKLTLSKLLLTKGADPERFALLLDDLPVMEQRKVLSSILKLFSQEYLDRLGSCESEGSSTLISAVTGALNSVVGFSDARKGHLVEWLTNSSGAGLGEGIGIRRAVLAALFQFTEKDYMTDVLEKSITQFGDQLYIKHSPTLQQEAHAQVLLLSAGYVYRRSPFKVASLLRRSVWMNAISNRLAATHQRARFLGMVVGEGLSALVEKDEKKRLNFQMDETNQTEGRWYKQLVHVSDQAGSIDPLIEPRRDTAPTRKANIQKPAKKPAPAPAPAIPKQPQQGFIIEELSDDEYEEDDDLVPYAKPDSDAEDSDDDPTLVTRNKPTAPVYIRDLIRYLRDIDNYDHQKLALTTAPTLIRRKASYGTEVAEHAEELASLLVGLQDKFEIDNFDDLRIQGMIALIAAQPKLMAPWFAKTFFDGDYSISQRASVLAVLGLSARELAGFETSTYSASASFPSKTLPDRIEQLWIGPNDKKQLEDQRMKSLKPLPPNALENVARDLVSDMLAPMAADAADSVAGPDVLKLSTFRSQLEGGNANAKVKYKTRTKPKIRSIPNTTAQLISVSFFSPLVARFQAALHSSSRTTRGVLFHPYLLGLYLKTLGLLVHAAGPSTLSLPEMTTELWGGLLLNTSIRAHAVGDLGVTQAILFALLALLDVNEDRMRDICRDMGREVVETQEWVATVFENTRGDGGGEENQVKMLSAAVLVRLREGIEKYQLLMVGDLIG